MEISGPQSKLLLQLMSATSLRGKVIANNIANQNTPGYKRQELVFEDLLKTELSGLAPQLERVEPQVVTDTMSTSRADGNNVQMELEMSSIKENHILYDLYASMLTGQNRMLQSAIHGDR
jgi:flagellar basal-body rod protein FlgB